MCFSLPRNVVEGIEDLEKVWWKWRSRIDKWMGVLNVHSDRWNVFGD